MISVDWAPRVPCSLLIPSWVVRISSLSLVTTPPISFSEKRRVNSLRSFSDCARSWSTWRDSTRFFKEDESSERLTEVFSRFWLIESNLFKTSENCSLLEASTDLMLRELA